MANDRQDLLDAFVEGGAPVTSYVSEDFEGESTAGASAASAVVAEASVSGDLNILAVGNVEASTTFDGLGTSTAPVALGAQDGGFSLAASVVAPSGGGEASAGSGMMTMSCACCGPMGSVGQLGAGSPGDGFSPGTVGAPSTAGTLGELAQFLRQGYWASVGSNFDWKWSTNNISFNITALTAQEQIWAREAFQHVSQVTPLVFTETTATGVGVITFVSPDSGQPNYGSAFANFSGPANGVINQANVSISADWASFSNTQQAYNYYFQTYLHEIGHALGLGHQGPYNGSATYGVDARFFNDSWQASIMSYFSQIQNTYNAGLATGSFAYVSSYMQADIMALQGKYGAPTSGLSSLHFYGFTASVEGFGFHTGGNTQARSFTMYANDGWVGLNTSDYTGIQTIRMNSGQFSSIYGFTDNVSQYASTMTYYNGGSGFDDITLNTSAPSGVRSDIIGNGGNDIFRSSGGTEHFIYGGAGNDAYTRVLVALNSDVALTRTSGRNEWTVSGFGYSADYLYDVETAQFQNTTVSLRQSTSNFNFGYANDVGATSDLLVFNGNTAIVWTAQSGGIVAGSVLGGGLSGWTVAATGDTDRDGDADILLQSGNTVVRWDVRNSAVVGGAAIGNTSGYTLREAADVDNDGDKDLILTNGGNIVLWRIQDGAVVGGNVIGSAPGWDLRGAGDFDGDGDDDLVAQDAAGTMVVWRMQNGAIIGGSVLGTAAGYSIVGTGDFNGDGVDDIIMQNGSGSIVDWLLNSSSAVVAGNLVAHSLPGWNVSATGDYNGDGRSDVVVQNGNQVVSWLMGASGTVVSGSFLTANSGGYSVVA